MGDNGVVNAAPFSFFNAIAFNPCMVVLGVEARPDRRPKDTSANIRELPEFVVNIVDRTLADAMNLCALPLAPGQSEVALAGLDTAASEPVRPPRIAQAPAALECRQTTTLQHHNLRDLVLGELRRYVVRGHTLTGGRHQVAHTR